MSEIRVEWIDGKVHVFKKVLPESIQEGIEGSEGFYDFNTTTAEFKVPLRHVRHVCLIRETND
jgi:hypothetical protein